MPVQDNQTSRNIASKGNGNSFETTINATVPCILETIQNELDAFEKRLLCSYSTLDTLPETEIKLPMLFIDNFSKIFRLWHETPVFKNSVPSKTFYDIFSLMFRSLNDETTNDEQTENMTGICDICDEEFEIIHNDAKRSYEEHEYNSETHIKLLHNFNEIGKVGKKEDDFEHVEPIAPGTLPLINQLMLKFDLKFVNVFTANEWFLEFRREYPLDIECHLCDTVFQEQKELINHCNSKIHKKRKSYFFSKAISSSKKPAEFRDDLIYTKGKFIYCALCQCVLPKKNRNRHVTGHHHIMWKNFARGILNIEEPYFHVINRESGTAFCVLCGTKFTYNHGIVPHCLTKNHILYKHLIGGIRYEHLK